ncbi:hypothetical protein PoMZ_03270 [Pyricularia oryzae]|uniref:Uncharacterized protein n=1 Tax=Pyricularia oryzae TaxID=318829 RepID=A0A4P7NCJ1_PYROR|nr:hypothetical protein PoMZ_03270 [Pyricularia oryzae]
MAAGSSPSRRTRHEEAGMRSTVAQRPGAMTSTLSSTPRPSTADPTRTTLPTYCDVTAWGCVSPSPSDVSPVMVRRSHLDLDLVLPEINAVVLVGRILGENKGIQHVGRHRPSQAQTARMSIPQSHLERLGGVGLPLPKGGVHGVVRHEAADLESAACPAVLHKLKVRLRIVEQRLACHANHLSRGGLGRRRLAVDAHDEEAQRRLLHHEGARQPKDHGLLRPRAVCEAAPGDPDQVGAVVGEGLDLGKVAVFDVGEEGVFELHGGNDGCVGGGQFWC